MNNEENKEIFDKLSDNGDDSAAEIAEASESVAEATEASESATEVADASESVAEATKASDTAAEPKPQDGTEEAPADVDASAKPKGRKKKQKSKRKLNIRSFKHGTMAIVFTIVFIAVVVVLNVVVGIISERFDTTADLTDTGIYSLSEDTETYLTSQLESDVTITVLMTEKEFEDQGSTYKQVNEILKKINMATDHVTLSYIDLDQNPNYTSQFTGETLAESYIVVESEATGRHRIISPYDYFTFNEDYLTYYSYYVVEGSNIEQEAVSAMMYVSNEDLVRVAFTEGYGEEDSSTLQTVLEKNGYSVETINLVTISEIDPEIDIVVMFAPSMDVDNENLAKLDKFLDNNAQFGKTVFYFASTSQPQTPNIESFLNDWGLSVGYSAVGQSDQNYLISMYSSYAHLQQILDTDYAGNTYGNTLYTFASDLRPVIQIWEDGARGNVEQEILMTTYDNAFLYPLDLTEDEEFSFDTAESGVFNDAVVAYRVHSSSQDISRLAVFGSTQLTSSTFMSMSNANNQDFFINMFNYISGKEDSITIKSKTFSNITFEMSADTANKLAFVLCAVIPVVVIALGIVIWVRRRHR